MRIPQVAKESPVIARKITRRQQVAGSGRKNILTSPREVLKIIFHLWQKRDSTQTALCFCNKFLNAGRTILKKYSPFDFQRSIRKIGPFQPKQFPTAQARKQQCNNAGRNSFPFITGRKTENIPRLLRWEGNSRAVNNPRDFQISRRITVTKAIRLCIGEKPSE